MALNTSKCNHLPPLPFKGLTNYAFRSHNLHMNECSKILLLLKIVSAPTVPSFKERLLRH